jgi:hypothetical protein
MRDYYLGNIVKHLYRNKDGDLDKAKFYLDKLIEHEAEKDDYVEIDMLTEFDDCLLGAVYDTDDVPVPVYDSVHAKETLVERGMSEDEAIDYLNRLSDGMRILWVNDIEIAEPKKPTLRLCGQ